MSEESTPSRQDQRRRQILAATLRLIRRHGTDITTAQIAAEAHCSKETLYNWFGDRDGIMMALVREQANAMGSALQAGMAGAQGSLEDRLKQICVFLLDMMTGDATLAVNRLAMAQACTDRSDLGQEVLSDWNEQVVAPFFALFEEGNRAGILAVHSPPEAFDNLVGLLVGDRQRQLLLGADVRPDPSSMASMASKAVQRWLILYRF